MWKIVVEIWCIFQASIFSSTFSKTTRKIICLYLRQKFSQLLKIFQNIWVFSLNVGQINAWVLIFWKFVNILHFCNFRKKFFSKFSRGGFVPLPPTPPTPKNVRAEPKSCRRHCAHTPLLLLFGIVSGYHLHDSTSIQQLTAKVKQIWVYRSLKRKMDWYSSEQMDLVRLFLLIAIYQFRGRKQETTCRNQRY